jgi:hypothetical protein
LERADESPVCRSFKREDGHVEGGQEVEVKRKREVHMHKGIKWSLIQVKRDSFSIRILHFSLEN